MLDGELSVEIGQGLEEFEELGGGEQPLTFDGGGGLQGPGVSHLVLGLRIGSAALDQYDVLGAHFALYDASACMELADGSRMCDGVPYLGQRYVLLGAGPELNVVDGVVEEFALTMVTDTLDAGDFVIQATITDPCGQFGIAHHDFSR